MEETKRGTCFVIMPISEMAGYKAEHFKHVYEDILGPAIREAGYDPKRADDDKSSSMIQVNIIRDIIESPMAICDLSTRNPNVLFELGIRQAFDLPVVLVQEEGTPRIFDISTINTIDYRKELIYREVIEDREKIKVAIEETRDSTKGINSIIKLLGIGKKAELSPIEMTADDTQRMLLVTLLNKVERIEKSIKNHERDEFNLLLENYLPAAEIIDKEPSSFQIAIKDLVRREKLNIISKSQSGERIRIYEMAKRLSMTNKELMDILRKSRNIESHMEFMKDSDFDFLKLHI